MSLLSPVVVNWCTTLSIPLLSTIIFTLPRSSSSDDDVGNIKIHHGTTVIKPSMLLYVHKLLRPQLQDENNLILIAVDFMSIYVQNVQLGMHIIKCEL